VECRWRHPRFALTTCAANGSATEVHEVPGIQNAGSSSSSRLRARKQKTRRSSTAVRGRIPAARGFVVRLWRVQRWTVERRRMGRRAFVSSRPRSVRPLARPRSIAWRTRRTGWRTRRPTTPWPKALPMRFSIRSRPRRKEISFSRRDGWKAGARRGCRRRAADVPRPQTQPMRIRRGRGLRSPSVSSERSAGGDRGAFEMSVSLYSVRLHQHGGGSLD